MACKACGLETQSQFNAEIGIHFPGLQNLDKPIVRVVPQVLVCLKCGVAEFTVPEAELSILAKDGSRGAGRG